MKKGHVFMATLMGAAMTGPLAGQEKSELAYHPAADPAAVVEVGNARFTILTPVMIRMEWSPDGKFEDRASQLFIHRRLPVPKFDVSTYEGETIIRTAELTLHYQPTDGASAALTPGEAGASEDSRASEAPPSPAPPGFNSGNLRVEFDLDDRLVTWTPGLEDKGNLKGTWRTLDGVSGASPLEPGLLSRDGWVVVDDSKRLLFTDGYPSDGAPSGGHPSWMTAREKPGAIDWYFFGYGRDYKRALRDFIDVAGRIPLPPRFTFGAWWSRYWAYSDEELRGLVGEFRDNDVPLDVLVIDMDWHLDGWTGYTWNPEYFPDPTGFLKWVHEQGLRATLNLHPADGIGKHEAMFKKAAKAMGLDPKKVDRVPFDPADPKYMEMCFKIVHHPLEKQGVDFWWMDYQQAPLTKIPGLDPLWWLNHLHIIDLEQRAGETGRRPMLFSRWGGMGNHRYQIGFSGDTFCNWPSLAFQPYFTATAGNVGYDYWSHDIGGHQPGKVEPELYARWIQWGALSPVLRTHTTKNPEAERRIWMFPEEVFNAARQAFGLRYELIPYIYTSARQCYDTGLPLCRPLYYEWPELDEAYTHGGEYLFGDQMLVTPVTEPMDPVSKCAQVKVWLPPGEWVNWFTGRTYKGPGDVRLLVPLDEIPLFVRAGAIIPAMPKMRSTGEKPVDPLILHIWPGASGQTQVYEDSGEGVGYAKGEFAWTQVTHKLVEGKRQITIYPPTGSFPGMLTEREYEIRLHDVWPAESVTVDGEPLPPAASDTELGWRYDRQMLGIVVRLPRRAVGKQTQIVVALAAKPANEAPLRDGLRGLVRLSSVLLIRSDLDPAVTKPLFELALAEEPPKDIPSAGRQCIERWPDYVSYCASLPSSLPATTDWAGRETIRLLGLYRKVRVVANAPRAESLTAEIELAPTIPAAEALKLSGEIKLSVAKPWSIESQTQWRFDKLSEAEPLVVKAKLAIDGSLQSGALSAAFTIRLADTKIDLPIEIVFLPSINAWWVIGPFDCPYGEGLNREFPPEKEIDLKATYEGKGGEKIGWRPVKREIKPGMDLNDEFFVDFDDVFGGRKNDAVAFALTYLHAPRELDAVLAMGTDDDAVVWLNGEEVHRYTKGRPYMSKQDRVPVKLREGMNLLLLKICQGGGDWGYGVHVEDADGKPLLEVTAELEPTDKPAAHPSQPEKKTSDRLDR